MEVINPHPIFSVGIFYYICRNNKTLTLDCDVKGNKIKWKI